MDKQRHPWYAIGALAGALAAGLPAAFMWGFTVDDALIPLRYARHLTDGLGYRFNALGPSTDGVTPLPWAFLLAPLASADLLVTLSRVKFLGVVVHAVSLGALGVALLRRPGERAHALAGLFVLALAFPVGAWAASGMETPFAAALATTAAILVERRPRASALVAGATAAFRPEMVAWAAALAVARSLGERPVRPGALFGHLTASALPFLTIALVRALWFGQVAPLAVMAKPSDFAHGATYAVAAFVVLLTPLMLLAPWSVARASRGTRALAVAGVVHVLVVALVGGDWMPYGRLLVPIAPSLVLVHAGVASAARASRAGAPLAWFRIALALVTGGVIAFRAAPAGRTVMAERTALVRAARPVLVDSRVVAALDIGWLGAATEATVVDLAGLTDPTIAALPGGHTSKRVDVAMLLDRGVDTVVVYREMRAVEARLVGSALFASHFERRERLTLGASGYDVYRRTGR